MNEEEMEIWMKTYKYFIGKQATNEFQGVKYFHHMGAEDAAKGANAAVREFRRVDNKRDSEDNNGSYVVLIPEKESTHVGLCKVISPFKTDGRASSYIRNHLEHSMAYVKELGDG